MRNEIDACPECGTAHIYHRKPIYQTHDAEWWCQDCHAEFDTPDTRERNERWKGGTRSSKTVRELLDADPDEVGP